MTELTAIERRVLAVAIDFDEQIHEVLSYEVDAPSLDEVMEATDSIHHKFIAVDDQP